MLLDAAVIDGDPVAAASAVALSYTSDDEPGIRRVRRGKSFTYVDSRGRAVRERNTLSRIRALAIPPAWEDVWICADPDGHIQATGRDARRRKQYRYHPKWRSVRDEAKYHRLLAFCEALPQLRAAVERDLACACLCKRKVVATVVALMERAQLRVGNDEYARTNGSYGATTLRAHHARIRGDTLELVYRGKSGVMRHVRVTDRRLARIVRRCRDLPGQRLFQYQDGDAVKPLTSTDVNDYLHEVTAGPFTAKDYRTWAATLGAALLLCGEHPADARATKRCIVRVLEAVAEKLGHTPAICRASYVHPRLLEELGTTGFERLARQIRRRVRKPAIEINALRAVEPLIVRFLRSPAPSRDNLLHDRLTLSVRQDRDPRSRRARPRRASPRRTPRRHRVAREPRRVLHGVRRDRGGARKHRARPQRRSMTIKQLESGKSTG
jgi:DNA topoisomerase I